LIFLNLAATAQIPNLTRQPVVDSLSNLLPGAKGTARVDVLNQLACELGPRSFDSSMLYVEEAIRLSEELGYSYGKGVATFNRGNCYYFRADIRNALINYLAAQHILESFKPTRDIASLFEQLALVNQYVRNTEKAKEYYFRASSCFLAIGDSVMSYWSKFLVGWAYLTKYQTLSLIDTLPPNEVNILADSALKYNNVVIEWATHRKSKPTGMAEIYNAQGTYCYLKGDSSALGYFLKALEYCDKISDTNWIKIYKGMVLANLGEYYFLALKDLKKGYSHSLLAADLQRRTERYDGYGCTLLNLGNMDLDRNLYQSAEKYFHSGLNSIDTFLVKVGQISHQPDPSFRIWGVTEAHAFRLYGLGSLVKFYEQTGDYKKALLYNKKYEEEKSLQTMDGLNREMMGIQTDYEDEIKRQEIAGLARDNELRRLKLNQTRILFSSIGGFLLIVFLIIMLWIQRKRSRSEKKALILEQKLLRSQMNPHFIFNSLSSIQNFIVTEKPDKASIYLSKFSKLVRNILDNSVEEFVKLEKEISTIENYLELQKVRYAGKFDYRIHIADEIDPESMKIPPMLAQPFIENAIEHGIKHRETPGHIDIRFSLKDRTLVFEVEDNGVGRQKAREIEIQINPDHKSLATSLTRERLVNLNRKLHKKIELEIIDLQNALGEATGTRVVFGVPV
jgi:tetratricopeptide (TPR) repeat protein